MLSGAVAGVSVLLEKKSRRMELALYVWYPKTFTPSYMAIFCFSKR